MAEDVPVGKAGDSKISVSASALYQVLNALTGPDYMIRELQAIRGLGGDDPITKLINEYNAAIGFHAGEKK